MTKNVQKWTSKNQIGASNFNVLTFGYCCGNMFLDNKPTHFSNANFMPKITLPPPKKSPLKISSVKSVLTENKTWDSYAITL